MGAPGDETLHVMGRHEAVGRRRQPRSGRRTDDVGGDDDHQLALVPLEAVGAEQGPEHRNIAEGGELADIVGDVVLQQAGDGEALSAAQFHRGLGAPGGQRGHDKVVQRDRVFARQLADLGAHVQVDPGFPDDGRREGQGDAEFLELDGHPAVGVGHQDGELAAGQEAGGFAGERGEIGLGQDGHQPFLLEGVDDGVEVPTLGAEDGADALCQAAQAVDDADGAGEGIGRRQAEGQSAQRAEDLPVEAQLLVHAAGDLGDADAQVDLVGRVDAQPVDDRFLVAGDAHGQAAHVFGNRGRPDDALENQGVVDAGDVHVAPRVQRADGVAQAAQVEVYPDGDAGQNVLALVHRVESGLAGLLAQQIDQAGGLDLDVGDLGVGDEDRAGRAVQAHQASLVDLQLQDGAGAGHEFDGARRAKRRRHARRQAQAKDTGQRQPDQADAEPCKRCVHGLSP